MGNAQNLDLFSKAHKLTIKLYNLTSTFPKQEEFGLISQIRKASSSINANLMERSHRNTDGEYRRFVQIARGSVGELKYHLLLARDLNYIDKDQYLKFKEKVNEISKMLSGLMKKL